MLRPNLGGVSEYALAALFAGLFGLLFGSFVNVIIYRVPKGESIVTPRSRCTTCDRQLAWYENVPLASWIALRGKCRTCKAPVSARYPLVEAMCAALCAAVGARFGLHLISVAYVAFTLGLVAISFIDFDTKLIHKKVFYPLLAICFVLLVAATAEVAEWNRLGDAVVAAVIAFLVFFVINWIYPRGLGFGDVRFSFLLGLMLGWQRPLVAFTGLFLGFLFGAVIGTAGAVISKAGRKAEIPFGPFLAAGAYVAVLYGLELTDWIFPSLSP